jgi:hypothetical protein
MSFIDNLRNRIAEVNKAATEVITDHVATTEVKESRLAICDLCEFKFKPTNQCKKCGCFLWSKTTLADAKCPVGKW